MSSALQTAVEDLRAALVDEDAGNGQVRDCAFEVVEAWDAATERTPAPEAAENTPARTPRSRTARRAAAPSRR